MELSAVHRVFSIPTILSDIFACIVESKDFHRITCARHSPALEPSEADPEINYCDDCVIYWADGVLFRCALVNHAWFYEVIRHLWKRSPAAEIPPISLSDLMEKVEPSRRQLYADWIEEGFQMSEPSDDYYGMKPDEIDITFPQNDLFENIKFPRLKKIEIRLDGCRLPIIAGEYAEVVTIDPPFDDIPTHRGVDQDDMAAVFDNIAISFPNAKSVVIKDDCGVYPATLKKFMKQMPKLEHFDVGRVHETNKHPWAWDRL